MLMFITGLLYLTFEENICRHSNFRVSSPGSRGIMGMQVLNPAPPITPGR